MNHVEYQTRQLIREIKRSNVYNQYRRLQMKIMKNRELYQRLNDFREACFVIQNRPHTSEDMERLEALNKEYIDILQDSDVREYLTAEQGLAMMMNQIVDQIYDSLDIDVSFLDN
ncbi:YlbF family regulator [Frisingicoccus sp.]|uniref:YlbF family regulator n=1 Tax=Frisingicoccus sp. TaxID=1918627 RepID=UPI00386A1C93